MAKNTCISGSCETKFCVESRLTVLLWAIGDFDDAMTHTALFRFRKFHQWEFVRANYYPLIFLYFLCQSNPKRTLFMNAVKRDRKDH